MTPREHRLLPHTADVGLEALGPDLPSVFEEAAFAIAGLTADIEPEALIDRAPDRVPQLASVELEGRDLVALAFAWLDELVGRVDVEGALAAVEVAAVVERAGSYASDGPASLWRLRARLATLPFDGQRVRRRVGVKAATYHRLAVERDDGGGWRLTAYLDI